MRLPNGYGGISKLSGNRRNPFRVRITKSWELVDGKLKQVYVTLGYYHTRKEAMIALADYNQNPFDIANKKLSFEDCYLAWSEKHYKQYKQSARSLKAAYGHCQAIKDMPILDIRLKHLQDIMDSVSSSSVSLQSKVKTVFHKTYQYAMENDIVQKDYSSFVKINQTPPKQDIEHKFFTRDEIRAVFQNLDWTVTRLTKDQSTHQEALVDSVVILLYTGMRIGELLNLRRSDVDLPNRIIHVHGTKTAAADRLVPIHLNLIPYIEHRLSTSKEFLLEDSSGAPVDYHFYITYFFKPFMKQINAVHTPHATRHTFISLMDKCGVETSSVTLKRIVGHSNSTVTEHYTHKSIDDLIKAIDKLSLM